MIKKLMVVFLASVLSGCAVVDNPPETIDDEISPNLYGIEDIEINVGDRFDSLAGVVVYDVQDGYITSAVSVEGRVDTSEFGTYLIKYRVFDSDENQTLELRYVTVAKEPE